MHVGNKSESVLLPLRSRTDRRKVVTRRRSEKISEFKLRRHSDHLIYFLYISNKYVVSVDWPAPSGASTEKKTLSLTNTSPALCFCCSLSIEGFVFGSPHISQNNQSRQQMSGPEDKSSRLGTINDVAFAQRCLWSFHCTG